MLGGVATAAAVILIQFNRLAPPPVLPPAPKLERGGAGRTTADQSADRTLARNAIDPNADPAADAPPPIVDRTRTHGGLPSHPTSVPVATADPDRRPRPPRQPVGATAERDAADRDAPESKYDRSQEARQRRLNRFGGNARTESSVEAGLIWLAAHQFPDGHWNPERFNELCPRDERCTGPALSRVQYSLREGLTGLATLAFLGAGYTHQTGPYQNTVGAAIDWLLQAQAPHGGFGPSDEMAGYNDSLATLALAECYAMTRDLRFRAPLERAVGRLVQSQQKLGGWDYLPTPSAARNDTSITAWVVQALQACSAAGIAVPPQTLIGASLHFHRAAQSDGTVWYSDSGRGFELDDQTLAPVQRYGPAMTACAIMSENILGWRLDAPRVRMQQSLLLADLPSARAARGGDRTDLRGEYYWYYGTVSAFQLGGDHWDRWNAHLRDAILPLQERELPSGRRRHDFGSWRPYGADMGGRWGKWGRMGGRVYTTAICTLTLEIYYRNTPAYLDDRVIITADDWRAWLASASADDRITAAALLADTRFEVGEPPLVDLLRSDEPSVALAAAVALAQIDSPLGKPVLAAALEALEPWERGPVSRALSRIAQIEALPPPTGRVRVFDDKLGIATLDVTRAYVGLKLDIQRPDDRVAPSETGAGSIARMEVMQRFTNRDIVVARLIDRVTDATPGPGDTAVGR